MVPSRQASDLDRDNANASTATNMRIAERLTKEYLARLDATNRRPMSPLNAPTKTALGRDIGPESESTLGAVIKCVQGHGDAATAKFENPEDYRADQIIKQLISDIRSDYPVTKLIRDLRGPFKTYLEETLSRIQYMPSLLQKCFQCILSGRTQGYQKEPFPYGRDVKGAMKDLRTYFEEHWRQVKKSKDEQDLAKAAKATCNLIYTWEDGRGQAEEDKAEKARKEAAKDEESPAEVIIGDFHRALKSYHTPHHKLVSELGDLSLKKVGHARNLPDILEGCFQWLWVPYEEDEMALVLGAMKEMKANYGTLAKYSRRMLVDMRELTRGKKAGECNDCDGEWSAEEAGEVMQHFGSDRGSPCGDEDEADMLWERTMTLCEEWGDLSAGQEEERMQEEREKILAYRKCVKVVGAYIDGHGGSREGGSESESESSEESEAESEEEADSEEEIPKRRSGSVAEEEPEDGEPLLRAGKRQRRS